MFGIPKKKNEIIQVDPTQSDYIEFWSSWSIIMLSDHHSWMLVLSNHQWVIIRGKRITQSKDLERSADDPECGNCTGRRGGHSSLFSDREDDSKHRNHYHDDHSDDDHDNVSGGVWVTVKSPSHGSRLWGGFKVKVNLRTNWHRVSDLVFWILGAC